MTLVDDISFTNEDTLFDSVDYRPWYSPLGTPPPRHPIGWP